MKDIKTKLITGAAVVLMALAAWFLGADVDWGKVGKDALSSEVTDTAQKLEDLNHNPAINDVQ